MKTWQAILLGVIFGLIASAILLITISPPRGEPVRLLPPSTPAPLVVHVAGAVSHPGVYSIPPNSRVKNAIDAAGGFLSSANQASVNLAAQVLDGQKVNIPSLNDPTPVTANSAKAPSSQATSSASGTAAPTVINLNEATAEQLDALPGIGALKAAGIIAYRDQHGPFKAIEEIQNVTGIGPSIFDRIKDLICVQNCSQ